MGIISNQKFRLTISLATLSCMGVASIYLYNKNQNISLQHNPIHQQNILSNQPINLHLLSQLRTDNQNQSKNLPDIKKLVSAPKSYPVIDELLRYKFNINGSKVFQTGKLPKSKVNFNQSDLLVVLNNTRDYFRNHSQADPDVMRPGILATKGVTVEDTLKTLDFMIAVLEEDIANKRITRLQDPNFINQHFRVIKWTAHNPKRTRQRNLRITKYAVFTHPGSRTKTSTFNIPVYSLKNSESTDKFYKKYTKQDVLSGIYEAGGEEFGKVNTLVYLTRQGFEEALMQGTILINFPDKTQAFFNVDKNNGMPYVRGLAARSQKRYWYFKQVESIKGYGHSIDAKISIKPGVTFAGDVLNVGLGKVVVMEYLRGGKKQLRLGVIADTGGAFLPNLYQLDFLAGIFKSQKDFRQYIRQLPTYAQSTYILVKK
ncbi:hypothetical protein [Calothrix rhizosoleniae]|uniref:hypothetical protein n=1 Tax=Calothrix rhizosoleniae TaxID=888997 RepID=UPI000B4A2046|nr:hypothetical protein [Calothrix rhizosoleniae]